MSLLWTGRQTAGKGPKPGLTLQRIVAEAIALADATGLGPLSMKTLAGRLGSGTMSLYRYLPGKEDLVSLMVDTVIGDPPAGLSTMDLRRALSVWAHGHRDVFRRHPWVLSLIGGPRSIGPNEMAWAEAAMRVLVGHGASPQAALDMAFAVNGYVRGWAQLAAPDGQGPHLDVPAMVESGRQDDYPTLIGILATGHDSRSEESFDAGLALLLDAIERRLA